jgi:hypothetical protein
VQRRKEAVQLLNVHRSIIGEIVQKIFQNLQFRFFIGPASAFALTPSEREILSHANKNYRPLKDSRG